MIRRPPRSTRVRSSAASDVYKRQALHVALHLLEHCRCAHTWLMTRYRCCVCVCAVQLNLRLGLSTCCLLRVLLILGRRKSGDFMPTSTARSTCSNEQHACVHQCRFRPTNSVVGQVGRVCISYRRDQRVRCVDACCGPLSSSFVAVAFLSLIHI